MNVKHGKLAVLKYKIQFARDNLHGRQSFVNFNKEILNTNIFPACHHYNSEFAIVGLIISEFNFEIMLAQMNGPLNANSIG